MTSSQHQNWINRGRPFRLMQPLAALRDRLRRMGYTVYDIGNTSHLDHQPPEDHTPFSATGWPGRALFGVGYAIDIMPPPPGSGLPSLQELGRALYLTWPPFLKYMNWGPVDDFHAVQDRRMPAPERRSSSDTGHIHVSGVTGLEDSHAYDAYNPLAVPAPVPRKDNDMAVIAQGAQGELYLCIGGFSHPIEARNIGDIRYVASQGAYTLARGPGNDAEWTGDGWVRKGWSPEVFGPVWQDPAPASQAPPVDLDALATKVAERLTTLRFTAE